MTILAHPLVQLKRVVNLLGEGMTSALESKVIFLDKIGKVSVFLQGVIDLGTAISDVRNTISLFVKDFFLTS